MSLKSNAFATSFSESTVSQVSLFFFLRNVIFKVVFNYKKSFFQQMLRLLILLVRLKEKLRCQEMYEALSLRKLVLVLY
jgi:hypothetical protein